MNTPSERMFQVSVPQRGKPDLLYPSCDGGRSLTRMQSFATQGMPSVALTMANGISESLTLAEMEAIYGIDGSANKAPLTSPAEPALYVVSGRNEGEKEDAVYLLWSYSGTDLHELFKERIYADSGVEQTDESPVEIKSETLVGARKNGVFTLASEVLADIPPPPHAVPLMGAPLEVGAAGSTDLQFFKVEVGFRALDNGEYSLLGNWEGLAVDLDEAMRQASDIHWDDRLDTTCRMDRCGGSSPRYLVCDGWGHIFVGKTKLNTRWVVDYATKKLVDAEVHGHSSGWTKLDATSACNLVESLRDNEVLTNADDMDSGFIHEIFEMPFWATTRPEIGNLPGHSIDGAKEAAINSPSESPS